MAVADDLCVIEMKIRYEKDLAPVAGTRGKKRLDRADDASDHLREGPGSPARKGWPPEVFTHDISPVALSGLARNPET